MPRDPLILMIFFFKKFLVEVKLKKFFDLMIRLQVPLQQPCYDFSFLQTLGFAELLNIFADVNPNNSP